MAPKVQATPLRPRSFARMFIRLGRKTKMMISSIDHTNVTVNNFLRLKASSYAGRFLLLSRAASSSAIFFDFADSSQQPLK